MEKAERETIIHINEADKANGFFRFGTSERHVWNKILKRVGEANLRVTSVNDDDSQRWYSAHIPIKYLSRTTLGIRKSGGSKTRGNPENFRKSPSAESTRE